VKRVSCSAGLGGCWTVLQERVGQARCCTSNLKSDLHSLGLGLTNFIANRFRLPGLKEEPEQLARHVTNEHDTRL